jgi:hypothetical protein
MSRVLIDRSLMRCTVDTPRGDEIPPPGRAGTMGAVDTLEPVIILNQLACILFTIISFDARHRAA